MGTWFSGLRSFVAGTKAKSEDVNFNFDKVSDALNDLFQVGRVQASGKGTMTTSFSDITGASKSITVDQPSILVAIATFHPTVESNAAFTGTLNIDGVDQTVEAVLSAPSGAGAAAWPVTATYVKELAEGAHTVKMRGKKSGSGVSVEVFDIDNTGFVYYVIPDPEP
jgi:hypothetical protein